jgi:hypothetical protein
MVAFSTGMRIGFMGRYYPDRTDGMVQMNLTQSGWIHLEGSNVELDTPVSREEFLIILANIDKMLLRATFHLNQTESWSDTLISPTIR